MRREERAMKPFKKKKLKKGPRRARKRYDRRS
jgi:hypothetical protein